MALKKELTAEAYVLPVFHALTASRIATRDHAKKEQTAEGHACHAQPVPMAKRTAMTDHAKKEQTAEGRVKGNALRCKSPGSLLPAKRSLTLFPIIALSSSY